MSSLRSFIALTPPQLWRQECECVQDEARRVLSNALTREEQRALRWVAPENIHLTLFFLGDVEAQRVNQIQELIARAAAAISPFHLQAESFGFFPPRGAPRVLWLGLNESPSLRSLHSNLANELRPQRGVLCPNADARSFQTSSFAPHLTLARIKTSDRKLGVKLQAALQKVSSRIDAPWPVKTVELIQSELTPQGAKYSVLSQEKLSLK